MPRRKPSADDVTRPLPHAVQCEKSVLSSILQEPERFIRLARDENVNAETFYLPAHQKLFGFLEKLNSDGVEIELISLVQRLLDKGQLDRIGGPAAITELYSYAPSSTSFATHLQEVKNKAVLRKIIQNSNDSIAAAYDAPSEVEELIESSRAKLAEVALMTENRSANLKKYRMSLMTAEDMEQETRDYFGGNTLLDGDPCFLPGFELGFRKHEFTVWLGVSNHGKSQAVQNQVAFLAAQGRKCFIASMEQKSSMTLAQILKAMSAYTDLHRSEEWDAAYRYITSRVSMFKGSERTDPKKLVEVMRQAYLNDGIDTFVLDNLMCLAVDRGDNSALAQAMDLLRTFFFDYPVHGHLVVHPRKTSDENVGKPATQNSIRGPAEIGDMPQSVVVVHRDMTKSTILEEMKASGAPDDELEKYWRSTPCGKFMVNKQRASGLTPVRNVWFHAKVNQFTGSPDKARPMFSGAPPWHANP